MPFNPQAILANLIEQERIKGHHSEEGRAIRTLARALSGWSSGNLSAGDVLVLCDQAVEDWLKARLKRSPWSFESTPALLFAAAECGLITSAAAVYLQKLRERRKNLSQAEAIGGEEVEATLEFCIQLIEKHW